MKVLLVAEDKDGDVITFNMTMMPEGAVIEKVNETALNLLWTPTSADNVSKFEWWSGYLEPLFY